METFTKIYIAYLGILAVFVCFIYWIAAKLRAERINRIRLERLRHDDFNKIFNLEYEVRSLKKSVESYEGLHESSKQINYLKQAEITKLEERINRQSDIIKELEKDKENLINCISRTGIRDIKVVVRKCNLGEIQSVISGTHAILNKPEKKGKNKEELKECAIEIDGKTQLRKYDPMKNAFPVDYNIAKEKAEEFIEKFAPVMPNEDWKEKARQCALIAVDEVLKAFDTEWAKLEFWTEELGDTTKYWQQVKLEIQTL